MNSTSFDEKLLVRLEKSLLQAPGRKSSELSQLLADDFVEFGCSGRSFTKLEVIQALYTEPAVEFETSDFLVRFLDAHIALLTYVAHRNGSPSSTSLRSSLWKQKDGRWQLVFHQGTPAAQRP
jgi:hypothetical protein